ncbi:hypothetical protein DLE60_31035 [Micromonospora globispora]|uniref:VCBS repeat-containing protein n=2 Tax=Micromonospora globispora TaxID=1450148 RepID=A0A317K4B9_9ACTN|nr:hypothetical protein DLJ46_13570 [Micromonospora globispora]PWU53185.1 hypothetical protein DLE60_31035 [Micromonospora globispora]RQW86896.1 hypothetical protein DKL51_26830 [Micromonospora globispora]
MAARWWTKGARSRPREDRKFAGWAWAGATVSLVERMWHMLRKRLVCGGAGGAASAVLAGLMVMVPSVAMAQSDGVSFSPSTDFPVGGDPRSVAVGDFNGDGHPDLVTANKAANTVSVLSNDGSGGFTNGTDFPVGTSPSSVAVGDFNGDGHVDLAVSFGFQGLSVLLNDGSGGFANRTDFSAFGGVPDSVVVGDFNGDGHPDLATNYASFGSVLSVFLNDGSGGFANRTDISVGTSALSLAVADFNSDGHPDLVAPNGIDRVTVMLNDGSGSFANHIGASVSDQYSVAVGDFNSDGLPDLATASFPRNTVTTLLQFTFGGGFFYTQSSNTVGDSPQSIAVGDFNSDGRPDAVTGNNVANTVSVLLDDVYGNLTNRTDFPVDAGPRSVAVGDFNSDGRPDLATANRTANTVSVLLNTTTPNTPPTITVAAGGQCVTDTSGSINLTVGDAESPPGDLVVTATSSNQALVPDANITVGGSDANRTLTVATVPAQTGTAIVTAQVSDGFATSTVDITVTAGGNQPNTISGTTGADMIFGKKGDDTISGQAGNDLLCGGSGNDKLIGNAGDDTMYGANGDDVLSGGAGADHFSGGKGTDTATDLTAAEGDTQDGTIP